MAVLVSDVSHANDWSNEASGKRVDEWSDGFEQRFGLYRVDFDTKRRTPKQSASFYRETVARNAVA